MIQSKIGLLVALLAYSVAMKLMPYVLRNCVLPVEFLATDRGLSVERRVFSRSATRSWASARRDADRQRRHRLVVGQLGVGLPTGDVVGDVCLLRRRHRVGIVAASRGDSQSALDGPRHGSRL